MPALGAQRLEHLFPQVVARQVALDAGRQPGHGRPAAGVAEPLDVVDAPAGGEARQLVVREPQVVLGQAQHGAVGGQPGQRHGRRPPAGQHHVSVGGQRVDELDQPPGAGRTGREHVGVVEHEADRRRAATPDRVGDRRGAGRGLGCDLAAAPPVAGFGDDGSEDVTGQHVTVDVGGLEPDPHVLAARGEVVLGHRLGQQRGLAQSRAAHHGGDPVLPPGEQGAQQPRPGQRPGPGLGRREPE
jgi:hypothetical protein